jgi:hypothetical protein
MCHLEIEQRLPVVALFSTDDVDKPVDASFGFDHGRERSVYVGLAADVNDVPDEPAAGTLHRSPREVQQPFIDVEDSDGRAELGRRAADRRPDAAATATRDNDDLILKREAVRDARHWPNPVVDRTATD